jgi:hypothetical protein
LNWYIFYWTRHWNDFWHLNPAWLAGISYWTWPPCAHIYSWTGSPWNAISDRTDWSGLMFFLLVFLRNCISYWTRSLNWYFLLNLFGLNWYFFTTWLKLTLNLIFLLK